MINVNTVKL